ncbi:hypothetical protein I4U23_003485 [Adineta vaga]|nr:hypothetical protein I4U23_003485 [Adineta vaga]
MAQAYELIRSKKQRNPSTCQICGSSAIYSFYGTIACGPCKMFFKRNAEKKDKPFKCLVNNQCEITINNRHICTACRLDKCFKQGMQVQMLRGSILSKRKISQSKALVRSNPIIYIPTLNLLQKDISTFDNAQWTLLSNIIHSYDESKLLSLAKTLNNENQLCQLHSITTINETLVTEFLTGLYEVAGICLHLNDDISHLPADDRYLLLQTAANNITCLGGIFVFYHSRLIDVETLWNHLECLYGENTMKYHRWSTQFVETDITLSKLGIALFAFSTNSRSLYRQIQNEYLDVSQILAIENQYAELTWKYLVYKYGQKQGVKKLVGLVRWMLAVTVFMSFAYNAERHVSDIRSLVDRAELTFLLDDVQNIC